MGPRRRVAGSGGRGGSVDAAGREGLTTEAASGVVAGASAKSPWRWGGWGGRRGSKGALPIPEGEVSGVSGWWPWSVGRGNAGLVFQVLLGIQYGTQPLLTRAFGAGEAAWVPGIVLLNDVAKVVLCCAALGPAGVAREFWGPGRRPLASMAQSFVPAACICGQNMLILFALRRLDGLTFTIINQTKILLTALFLYVSLGKRQSGLQSVGLVLLLLSAVALNAGSLGGGSGGSGSSGSSGGHGGAPSSSPSSAAAGKEEEGSAEARERLVGMGAVLLGNVLSATTATYGEHLTSSSVSRVGVLHAPAKGALVFTTETALWSIALVLATSAASGELAAAMARPGGGVFRGIGALNLVPVMTGAVGGMLVGQVTKHAGSVRKGFSLVGGLMLSAVLQRLFLGRPFSSGMVVALPLAVGGMLLHALFPPRDTAKKVR